MLCWGGIFLTIISFCFTINYFNFSLSFVIWDDLIFPFLLAQFIYTSIHITWPSADLSFKQKDSNLRKIQATNLFKEAKPACHLTENQPHNRSPPSKKKKKVGKKMGNSQKPEERWSLLHLDRFQWVSSIEKQKGYWFFRVPQSSLWIK